MSRPAGQHLLPVAPHAKLRPIRTEPAQTRGCSLRSLLTGRAVGTGRWYSLSDINIIGYYTVLPSGCSASGRTVAVAAVAPAAFLGAALSASAAAAAAQQAAMVARLDAAKPVAAALLAEPPAALSIAGANASAPLVWQGVPGTLCFHVPPSANLPTKVLTLYVGDGSSGVYYPGTLGAASAGPLPAAAQGCVNFTLSRGLPAGPYTLALEDSASGFTFAALAFAADKASVSVTGYGMAGQVLAPTIAWSAPAGRATANDTIRVADPSGATVAWVYTSCKCAGPPGRAPAPAGSFAGFQLRKGALRGGYTFELRVGGMLAAVAPNVLPWDKLGW